MERSVCGRGSAEMSAGCERAEVRSITVRAELYGELEVSCVLFDRYDFSYAISEACGRYTKAEPSYALRLRICKKCPQSP